MDTFQGQVHSPGAVGAMESLTTQIQILEEEAHIAKVHIIEIFFLKSVKQVLDARNGQCEGNANEQITSGLQKQLNQIAGKVLGVTETDVCPLLIHFAREISST